MRVSNNDNLVVDGVRSTEDMSTSFELAPLYIGHVTWYAIQLVFTGSPNGTFKLQASNDPGRITANLEVDQYKDVNNWTDIINSDQVITESGDHTWDAPDASYLWVRVVWTAGSGSGTLISARMNEKGI